MTRYEDLDGDTVPLITWIALGLAGAVFAATAWVYVTPPPNPIPRQIAQPTPTGQPGATAAPARGAQPLAPIANPLNIAPLILDAESRSHLWDSDPALVTITTLIGPGGPLEPIEIQFGIPRSGHLPGSQLKPERLTIRYANGRAEQKRGVKSTGYSVATPNCPLEIAVKKLPPAALESNYRIAVFYSYSKKESRPLWLFTEANGVLHRIDGDTCTVLIR